LVFLSNIFKTSNEKLKFTPFFFIKSKYEAKVSDFEIRMYYFFILTRLWFKKRCWTKV